MRYVTRAILFLSWLLASCQPGTNAAPIHAPTNSLVQEPASTYTTPIPTRTSYLPGTLVDYLAQNGDTLTAIAIHFNTSENEIRKANPILPTQVTTLPAGLPMKIPIYFLPLWGSAFQVLPDNLYIYGPAQIGFDVVSYVKSQSGWLKNYEEYVDGKQRKGGEVIEYLAQSYSISARLIVATLEYQVKALTQPETPTLDSYLLGYRNPTYKNFLSQLIWMVNTLNNGYYGWRTGHLTSFEHGDGRLERPDPWQNAATVALQYYFSRTMSKEDYNRVTQAQGWMKTYRNLFGDPWLKNEAHIPGSLTQPALRLPFQSGKSWAFTGGPHTGWGEGDPFSALDFAPPAVVGGCSPSEEFATAVADGIITRASPAISVLDLDGDNDERTGWVIFYLHVATEGKTPIGTRLKTGDPIGKPSCEGGRATGTHIHIARKFNGEWIAAEGPLAFNLEGWIAQNGKSAYEGSLVRYSQVVRACVCSDKSSQLQSGAP